MNGLPTKADIVVQEVTMTDRALLVGINSYPTSPLRGCVNDILDVATFLRDRVGFSSDAIELLADQRASKTAILQALRKLVHALQPGDRAVFHFSGHGVQLPSATGGNEADGLDESVCPVDFTWYDEQSAIRDDDFRQIFAAVPPGVRFLWVSDSCHSGDLNRPFTRPGELSRYMAPPSDLAWRIESVRRRSKGRVRSLRDTATPFRLAFVSGCSADQTSADATFDDRYNGALTYYLLRELHADGGLSRSVVDTVALVSRALASSGFSQRPTVEGPEEQLRLPVLGRLLAPPSPQSSLGTSADPPWRAVFEEIDERVAKDAALARQIAAHSTLFTHEISRVLMLDLNSLVVADLPAWRGGTVVRTFWWGFHIEISHQDLSAFLNTATPINAVAAAIGPVTGPAAPFVALVAGFIAGALEVLRGLDRGRGAYVSMSWFAPGVFVPTSV
jgi:hypothetical protein